MARVYVSSTYADLIDHRQAVYTALRALRHDVVAMEDYVASDERPVDRCVADVASSDIYVGIFALRYGHVPGTANPDGCSITELEYRKAGERQVPRLIFLLDQDALWHPRRMDGHTGEGDHGRCVRELRVRLERDHTVSHFRDPQELGRLVAIAVTNHLQGEKAAQIQGEVGEVGGEAEPGLDLRQYFTRLGQQYGRLDLDALTPPEREEYLQIELRRVFVEQHVREDVAPVDLPKQAWERLRALGEIHGDDGPDSQPVDSHAYFRKPARPVLDVLTEPGNRLTVLLGDPGAGKTSLARYLTLSLIERAGDPRLAGLDRYVPFLVELRAYAIVRDKGRCSTFLDYLAYLGKDEGYGLARDDIESYLRRGDRALVIFDGLDELFDPADREAVSRQIAGFATTYPQARVVVTSRIIGYRRAVLADAGFTHFTLQELNEDQIDQFVRRWYALALHDRPDDAEARRQRLHRAIKDSRSIQDLAGNPLLLTILAIIGKQRELPRERWQVYEHAAEVLIEHWDVNKHLANAKVGEDFLLVDIDDKKELLRRIAVRMQEGVDGQGGNRLDREALQQEFERYLIDRYGRDRGSAKVIAKAMIGQFHERNFVLSRYGGGLYGFVHRALLEYFCASTYIVRFEKRRELDLEQLKTEVFERRWRDESWAEVLHLICGMLDERFAGEIVEALAGMTPRPWPSQFSSVRDELRNIVLAVQCLAEIRNLPTVTAQAKSVLQAVIELIEHQARTRMAVLDEPLVAAVQAIGPHWPEREAFRSWLFPRGLRAVAWSGSELLGKVTGVLFLDSDPVRSELERLAREAASGEWRMVGLVAFAQGWPHDHATLTLLQQTASEDPHAPARRSALTAIAAGWHDDAATLPLLRKRAIWDADPDNRSECLRLIADGWPDDPATLPFLHERAATDDDIWWVLQTCLTLIARGWPDDPATLPLLRESILHAGSWQTRSWALRRLAFGWRDDPQTLTLVRELAANAPERTIRRQALELLGQEWPDDPQTRPFLHKVIEEESDGAIRGGAVEGLAMSGQGEPETLPLLRQLAARDQSADTRKDALVTIARHWSAEPETRRLLEDRAEHDSDGQVRAAAIRQFWFGYSGPLDDRIRAFLQDRAANDLGRECRIAAITALARRCPDAPETLPFLCNRAVTDLDEQVRRHAVTAVAQGWPNHSGTLPLLKERAERDDHRVVRAKVLTLLAEGWSDDPEARALITPTSDRRQRGGPPRGLRSPQRQPPLEPADPRHPSPTAHRHPRRGVAVWCSTRCPTALGTTLVPSA